MCLGGFSEIVTQTNHQFPEPWDSCISRRNSADADADTSKKAATYIPPLASATAISKLVVVARSIISRRGDLPAPQGHNKMDGTHYTGPPPRSHASRPQIQHRQSSTNSISIRRLPASTNTQSASTRLQSPNLIDRLDRIQSNSDNTANRTSQDSDHEGRRRSFSAPAPFGHEHATARFSAGSGVGAGAGAALPTSRPESGISFASRPLSGTILQDIAEAAEDTRTPKSESQAVFELPGSVPEVPGGWRDSRTEEGRLVQEQQDVPQRYGSASRRLRSATASGRLSRGKNEMSSRLQRGRSEMSSKRSSRSHEYESSIVDVLDVVGMLAMVSGNTLDSANLLPQDPYVSTLTTLNNVQNSLFVPDLGRFLNRKPTYELYASPQVISDEEKDAQDVLSMLQQDMRPPDSGRASDEDQLVRRASRATITSQLSESRYAVLPHGVTLDNWSQEDKDLLNDHVRHMLHSKREKFRRQMHAFRNYVKKPLGLFVTVYAFLVTTFGLVWVLFLIGWISGGSKHGYDVNVIDNVLVALFALIGDVLGMFIMSLINYFHN